MRRQVRLNASHPSESVDLDFTAVAIVVDNPTASPVLIRTGAPDFPDTGNADVYVPAGESKTMPCNARTFGVTFDDPAALATPANSGLFSTCIVLFLDANERIPTFGSASFLSLSISSLSGGLVAYTNPTTTAGPFDIGAWGGAIIHVSPTAGSGQGAITIDVANAAAGPFRNYQTLAFWPGIPLTISVPQVARFMRLTISNVSIPGQPVIAGMYSVRATLAEIVRFDYQVTGAVLSNAYNVGNLSESSWILATYGVPSISIALRNTGGTGFYGQVIVETSTAVGGPWALVTTREQNISAGSSNASMYRTLGTLGPFTRVRLLNNGVAGPITGNIDFSIQPEQDLAGVLSDVYRAIGDVSQPVNIGQSVYSQLALSRILLASIENYEANISGKITLIELDIDAIRVAIQAINTRFIASGNGTTFSFTTTIANTWQFTGQTITVNFFINTIVLSAVIVNGAPTYPSTIELGVGTVGVVTGPVYSFVHDGPSSVGPVMRYMSVNQAGLFIPASISSLWIRTTNAQTRVAVNMGYNI